MNEGWKPPDVKLDMRTHEELRERIKALELAQEVHISSLHEADEWRDELTAERDALREIVDHMTKHGVPPEHSYEVLRADNERLRAEVAPNWKQGYANMADGVLALEAQLTELREAVEAVRDGAELELDVSDSIAYVDNEALKSLLALLAKLPPR